MSSVSFLEPLYSFNRASTPHWIYRSTGKRKETESIESTPPPYLKSLSVGDIVIRFWLLSSSIKEFVNNTKTTETRL